MRFGRDTTHSRMHCGIARAIGSRRLTSASAAPTDATLLTTGISLGRLSPRRSLCGPSLPATTTLCDAYTLASLASSEWLCGHPSATGCRCESLTHPFPHEHAFPRGVRHDRACRRTALVLCRVSRRTGIGAVLHDVPSPVSAGSIRDGAHLRGQERLCRARER